MKFLSLLFLIASACVASGLDIITATITVTNTPTTNGQTLTVNANVRTWTNSVVVPGSQILTNASIGGSATNMFNAVSVTPFSGLALAYSGTNGITLRTVPGGALAVSLSAGWGSVVLTTNTLTTAVVVRVPYAVEGAAQQTNITSGVVAMVNADQNTNSISTTALALANYDTLSTAKVITGVKRLTSTSGEFYGHVTNATSIGGMGYRITNGVFYTNTFSYPSLTNGANYGAAFSSPGAGASSEQFGVGALALGIASLSFGDSAFATNTLDAAVGTSAIASGPSASAFGNVALALGPASTALGKGASASEVSSTALGESATSGHQFSTAIGQAATTTADNQVRLGTSTEHVSIPGNLAVAGNTELHYLRYPITSLANGVNAALPVLTNTLIEVSGPTGAFTVDGIANGSNGKFLIIINQTGQDMGIAHQSGSDGTAANRIISLTGATRTTTGNGAATLVYSGAASRWILIGFEP